MYYCQTKKTLTTETLRLITAMIRTCEQATESLTTCNYHCCLWYSFHMPVWHFSWNKIPFQKNISTVYGFLSFSGVFYLGKC